MLSSLLATTLFLSASLAASSTSSPTVVCVAGQCLQGYTNITLGATLSASGAQTSLQLLPGTYTSSTNPELLHELLTSSNAALAPSAGFSANSSLPFTLALQPGIAVYPGANYSEQSTFHPLPQSKSPGNSTATPLSAGSLALSSNVWAALAPASGSSNNRVIFWDSAPDVSQLPSSVSGGSLSLLDIQSASCSPPCSGAGVCSASGTCTCPPGFTGESCESCASGFFGPTCEPCPADCETCDQGISGSGRCLKPIVTNAPSSCNCLNGQCGSNGQCSCITGWTTADNGTACAKCSPGFFLDSSGNCEVCNLGCEQCADSSGDCVTCKSGFTQNANDATSCVASQSATSSGTVCPDGSFSNGSNCTACSPECQTCSGPTSNDCIICGTGKYSFNGSCVSTDDNGVCSGSNLIANNNKHECDNCPVKCTSCKIPGFSVASTINQAQCTGCLPGFVLSQGQCVESCPSGTFLSPQDNLTCTACDSSCGTCVGSSTFCLTCNNNQLASNGSCVSSCPSNTFSSSGSCLSCHPDCATCTGSSFNQCSSCSSSLPVLTNGRCLPTCSQSEFFDTTSSTCQPCDSSCSSCAGSGPSNCLACSSSSQVLRGGTCVSANCANSSSVITGLGLCLSDLVFVPPASGTNSAPPLPTITGISSPVSPSSNTSTSSGGGGLAWWEILLMALGCAFLFVCVLMLWRRHARKMRKAATAQFAKKKGFGSRIWHWGERLFRRRRHPAPPADPPVHYEIKMAKMGGAEDIRHAHDVEKIVRTYDYEGRGAGSSRAPSPLPSLDHLDIERDAPGAYVKQPVSRGPREVQRLNKSYAYSVASSSRAPSPLPSLGDYDLEPVRAYAPVKSSAPKGRNEKLLASENPYASSSRAPSPQFLRAEQTTTAYARDGKLTAAFEKSIAPSSRGPTPPLVRNDSSGSDVSGTGGSLPMASQARTEGRLISVCESAHEQPPLQMMSSNHPDQLATGTQPAQAAMLARAATLPTSALTSINNGTGPSPMVALANGSGMQNLSGPYVGHAPPVVHERVIFVPGPMMSHQGTGPAQPSQPPQPSFAFQQPVPTTYAATSAPQAHQQTLLATGSADLGPRAGGPPQLQLQHTSDPDWTVLGLHHNQSKSSLNSDSQLGSSSSSRPSPPLMRGYDPEWDALAARERRLSTSSISGTSVYSQITGMPPRAPQPRQPTRGATVPLASRFSATTCSTDERDWDRVFLDSPRSQAPTPAQEYARTVTQQQQGDRGAYWLQPTNTGGSAPRNPFLS